MIRASGAAILGAPLDAVKKMSSVRIHVAKNTSVVLGRLHDANRVDLLMNWTTGLMFSATVDSPVGAFLSRNAPERVQVGVSLGVQDSYDDPAADPTSLTAIRANADESSSAQLSSVSEARDYLTSLATRRTGAVAASVVASDPDAVAKSTVTEDTMARRRAAAHGIPHFALMALLDAPAPAVRANTGPELVRFSNSTLHNSHSVRFGKITTSRGAK
eukprot:1272624-Amphidinium_carterae.1